MKLKIFKLLLILMITTILLSACGLTNSTLTKSDSIENVKQFIIVTSFYPMYIETLNVTKGIPNVQVINMTKPQTGCLHDFQLTPEDLKTLEKANVFIINGAGMEAFMEKVIKQRPNIKVIESSKGIALIKDKTGEDNPHVWVSISNAILQVKNIGEELAAIDTKNASGYRNNTLAYVNKLEKERDKMHKVLDDIKVRNIITFHEAFPYFAKEFNLKIAAVIEREPGSEPTPKELDNTIKIVKATKIKALFAEPQYPAKAAETIARETGAKVYTLDPAVLGAINLNAYMDIMDQNLKTLQEALK